MKKIVFSVVVCILLVGPGYAQCCPENSMDAFCTARRVKDTNGSTVGFLYSVFFDYTPAMGERTVTQQFNRWLEVDYAAVAGFEIAGSQFFDEPFTYDNKGDDVFGAYWNLPTDSVEFCP